jgi:nitroreductase
MKAGYLASHPVVAFSGGGVSVLIDDAWRNTCISVGMNRPPTDEQMRLILSEINQRFDTSTIREAREWFENGWWPSLQLYMASISSRYSDIKDADGSIRRTLLGSYEKATKVVYRSRAKRRWTTVLPSTSRPKRSFEQALFGRRTTRVFSDDSIELSCMSSALWRGFASVRNASVERAQLKARGDKLHHLRSYGLVQRYIFAIHNVTGIYPGLYEYRVNTHSFVRRHKGKIKSRVAKALWDQSGASTAAATCFFCVSLNRYFWRYRHEQALRNLFVETGRIAQRLIIELERFKISCFPTPAINETNFEAFARLGINKTNHYPLYSLSFGRRR